MSDVNCPIQPVDNPILCSPYDEPNNHWVYDDQGVAHHAMRRRPASYWYKTQRTGSAQQSLPGMAQEQSDDLPLPNQLREDVRRWRKAEYRGASNTPRSC